MYPGEYRLKKGDVELNTGRKEKTILISNTGDRPIQVGSHFHFAEVNRDLAFDRKSAIGMRLSIPAGTAVRFEPGEEKEVKLVELGGKKYVYGLNDLTNGSIKHADAIMHTIQKEGFKGGISE